MKRMMILVLVGLLALLAAGCQAIEIGVNTGRDGASIEITVSEDELNTVLAESAADGENGVSFTPTVQFENGQIILTASLTDETGASASGSITLVVTQQDNQLRLFTTGVTITGTDSAGAQALNLEVALNREVAAEVAGQTGAEFDGSSDSIYVESIEIVPDEMTITIRLPR